MKRNLKLFSLLFLIILVIILKVGKTSKDFSVMNAEKKYNTHTDLNNTTDNLPAENTITADNEAKEIPVLMYHHLLKSSDIKQKNDAIVSVEEFEEQMKLLHDNNYKTVSLKELQLFLKGDLRLPKKSVVITFDDGYLSNYTYAYPILKKYGFKAAVFVITSRIEKESHKFTPDKLQYLSMEDIESSKDVITYGGHTNNLHDVVNGKTLLIRSSADVAEKDLKTCKDILNTDYFAYPYGQYTEETINILNKLGYTMAFTTQQGDVKKGDNPYTLKRYFVGPDTTIERFKTIINFKK
ncbi:polysaccharide deacetylase family protein [Aceticella autotrophica]|nr:polysaccharide deacetylase family protein [Aceticella autotrophica]